MTSTITIDASRVPGHDAGGSAPQSAPKPAMGSAPRLTFGGVLHSERIKLSSLRSIRLTLLITVLAGLGLSAMIALLWSREVGGADAMMAADAAGLQNYLLIVSTFTAPFLSLVFGVLGVFAVTSEYSSGMILSTLTAVPQRTPVLVAKAIVTAAVAAVTAIVLVLGGLALAMAFLPESAGQLGSTAVISGGLGTVAYLVLITLLAFGIATMLRSTAGGVAVIAGVTFVLPIAMQVLMLTGWEWLPTAAAYLPSDLGSTLAAGIADASTPAGMPVEGEAAGLGYWQALIAMVVWAVAALVPAALLFKRRDAR
ncbi:ABC transporter permease subunit [Leucobacter sp. VD1]|uniref:ABC transporter permease subunit n=1 Tax=Leucobacter sp. VD1 TaxID=3080381 RepID=UPI003016ABFF